MAEQNNSLVNLGNLAEPAKVLIEKISDAVGGIYKPYQIKRVARAESEAEKIKAITQMEISEIQRRGLSRLLLEEETRQQSIEDITTKSLSQLEKTAHPENIEKDWLVDFFSKARLVSDEEMQDLWSKILAGEANLPGTFSKRILASMAMLDKKDAASFLALCKFAVKKSGDENMVLIFDSQNEIYTKNGINFGLLKHLDSIGLISFETLSGYQFKEMPKKLNLFYHEKVVSLTFANETNNNLPVGHVVLTSVGTELFKICEPHAVEGFVEYISKELESKNITVSVT